MRYHDLLDGENTFEVQRQVPKYNTWYETRDVIPLALFPSVAVQRGPGARGVSGPVLPLQQFPQEGAAVQAPLVPRTSTRGGRRPRRRPTPAHIPRRRPREGRLGLDSERRRIDTASLCTYIPAPLCFDSIQSVFLQLSTVSCRSLSYSRHFFVWLFFLGMYVRTIPSRVLS